MTDHVFQTLNFLFLAIRYAFSLSHISIELSLKIKHLNSCLEVHWHFFFFLKIISVSCLGFFRLSHIWIFDPESSTNIESKFWLLQNHFLSPKYLLLSILWSFWIRASRYLRSSLDVKTLDWISSCYFSFHDFKHPFNTSSEESSFRVVSSGASIKCVWRFFTFKR